MSKSLKNLPVGVESFAEMRREEFYFVDKTGLIKELLNNRGKVNLFTRPRRFGKTLSMSMMKSFFEIGCDESLFEGLEISYETKLCEEYMGQFPVVSLSLKGVEAFDFQTACRMMARVINEEARRLQFLLESERLTDIDKEAYYGLLKKDMDIDTLSCSIREFTEVLHKHYGKRVIVLIDEYDVPLAKANEYGYYDEMVMLVRSLFGAALKTNENLQFAVLTGCLRVAKESIFTGLNNFKVLSIMDAAYDEYFGFTDTEVREMLRYFGFEHAYDKVKEWYDGYRFGNTDVYCPWDMICYCDKLRFDPKLQPQNFWINTSGNQVIEHFIERMDRQKKFRKDDGTEDKARLTKGEMERLINGDAVQKEIHQELTYKDVYSSVDNIWSVLFMTGYLTRRGDADGNTVNLVIPNREIRNVYTEQIMKLFKEQVSRDGETLDAFCEALLAGEPEEVEKQFTSYMEQTISVRDTFVRKPLKENFYHGILLGILGFKGGWSVTSNREAGDGFSDIQIAIDDEDVGIVIEIKYAQNGDCEAECRKALKQIDANRYAENFYQDEVGTLLKYGIACSRKKCRVMLEKVQYRN
jgi:hypothetical protein